MTGVTISANNSDARDNKSEQTDDANPNDDSINYPDQEQLLFPQSSSQTPGGTSTVGAIFLIVNAALGAGLLNFPKAFDLAGGVLTAVLVQAVLLVFIMLALIILAKTSNLKQSATLQEVMDTAAGPWGRRATAAIVAIYCFGTCITFLIIIGDQFDRAFASLVGDKFCHSWYLNRDFIMPATSLVLILPLCYTRKIDFLKYASVFGVFTMVYVVILILVEYAVGDHVPGEIKVKPDKWVDVFTVIPVICFGYQCHVSVIPIYSCMKHRNIKHFSIASGVAIAICCFTYTGAATFGYLTFGSKVSGDILTDYSASKPSVMIALIAMALKTYTTYPILLFCGREGISTIIKDLFVKDDTPEKEKFRRYLIATVWFACSLVMAIEIPDIGAVINMLGSLAAIFIFVFPGICLLQTTLMKDPSYTTTLSKLNMSLAIVFLLLGAFLFGCVLTQGIIFNLSSASTGVPLCVPESGGRAFTRLANYLY
eukprot:GFUD01034536.1.p1 GENE.GFUD01034536.1~~GFUD01034536.1.p1  ORF type:complete len:483 (+),score=120.87 GFUD01034536.1:70-1518(+)